MAKFKKISLNIKAETLENLIMAYLSGYAPTRASAGEECNVSKMTSGKVANALIQSGFMNERQFSNDGKKPCFHLFCKDGVRILIIDLSSSAFKMSIVNSYGEAKFHTEYDYDASISPDDNLNIFFSRYSHKVKHAGYSFCAISVITPDKPDLITKDLHPSKEYINRQVIAYFGKIPASHLTLSETISESIKFKVHSDHLTFENISYIFIGRHISAFHIHQNGSITVCSPTALFPDIANKLSTLHTLMTKASSDELFVRIAHFMGCAFSPSYILLESDVLSPDSTTEELLIRRFRLSGQTAPNVYFKNNFYPLCTLGAVRHTLFKVIKRYVINDRSQNT